MLKPCVKTWSSGCVSTQFSNLVYQAIARFAELTGAHFERRDAISQCLYLIHGNSNSLPFRLARAHSASWSNSVGKIGANAVLKPQPLKQIVLNCTSAIDETKGAIKRLTSPERFVLLFWQAFKLMVRG